MAQMSDTEVLIWRAAARSAAIREAISLADRKELDGLQTRQLLREVINLDYPYPKDALADIAGGSV